MESFQKQWTGEGESEKEEFIDNHCQSENEGERA
jgi:hypothetical protein